MPQVYLENIKNLVQNYGERAFKKDPMDRIISFKEVRQKEKRGVLLRKESDRKSNVCILTTENQLAQRLAKKIKEVYGGKPSVSIFHSHQDKITRIKIDF